MKQITSTFVSGRIEEFPELQEAHRKVKSEYESLHQRMKSLDRRQIDTLPEGDYTVERKYDGIFCGCINTQWHSNFIMPSGNVYRMPLTYQYDSLTIGELFYWGPEHSRERVHDILSALAKGGTEHIRFHKFGIDAVPVSSNRILEVFDQYLERAAEGVVIRQVNGSSIWKLKPKMNIDCVVIGYTEETPGEVKSLLCGLVRPDGCIQPLGAVGSNINERERRYIWTILQQSKISTHQPIVHDGQSVQPVLPVHYIEISCNDIVTEKSDGSPIIKPCYNLSINIVSTAPFCTLRGAYFERIRHDKAINGTTTRQVTDYVHIKDIDIDCQTLKGAASQVIEEVRFVKGEAVKRLLMIERGSEPDYAIHLTDYSPNRATPTSYEIQVTNDADQATSIYDKKSREIEAVRGWSRA